MVLTNDIQFGMLAGGQIVNREFIYSPGVIVQYSLNTRISPWIQAGLGLGIQAFESETILPVFLDLKAQFKEGDKAPFLGVNIGHTAGWSRSYRNVSAVEYEGGFYFSPYYSFQFPVAEKVNLLFAMGYIHQIGEIDFLTEFEDEIEEEFALDYLTLRIGARF